MSKVKIGPEFVWNVTPKGVSYKNKIIMSNHDIIAGVTNGGTIAGLLYDAAKIKNIPKEVIAAARELILTHKLGARERCNRASIAQKKRVANTADRIKKYGSKSAFVITPHLWRSKIIVHDDIISEISSRIDRKEITKREAAIELSVGYSTLGNLINEFKNKIGAVSGPRSPNIKWELLDETIYYNGIPSLNRESIMDKISKGLSIQDIMDQVAGNSSQHIKARKLIQEILKPEDKVLIYKNRSTKLYEGRLRYSGLNGAFICTEEGKAELYKTSKIEGMTTLKLSVKFGVCKNTIRRYLKKYKAKLKAEAANTGEPKLMPIPEILEKSQMVKESRDNAYKKPTIIVDEAPKALPAKVSKVITNDPLQRIINFKIRKEVVAPNIREIFETLAKIARNNIDDADILKLIELNQVHQVSIPMLSSGIGMLPATLETRMLVVRKKYDLCGIEHREEKYQFNAMMVEAIKPATVIDVCAGPVSYYKVKHPDLKVVSNDINKDYEHDYNMDMGDLLALEIGKGNSYDMVDVDAFAYNSKSFYFSVLMGVKLAKKAFVVTTSIRTAHRLAGTNFNKDSFEARWGITKGDSPEVCVQKFQKEIKRIGVTLGKNLEVSLTKEFQPSINRMVFLVK